MNKPKYLLRPYAGGDRMRMPQVDKTIALLFAKIALFEALHLPLSFRSGALEPKNANSLLETEYLFNVLSFRIDKVTFNRCQFNFNRPVPC